MTWPDFQEQSGLFRDLRQQLRSQLSLSPGSFFLLGISGGPDSMFLAYFFLWLRAREGCQVALAHFNHQLRPAADQVESQGLADFAARWQLPFYTGLEDVKALADQRQAGLEEAARTARHHFFDQTLANLNKGKTSHQPLLALGHNQDDLVETLLINLGRGSGLAGLTSLPYFDGRIVRPLLSLPSQEIRDFLDRRGLSYYTDESNDQDIYLRNRIRHAVLPAWREALGYDPGPQLFKLTESLRAEREALATVTQQALASCRLAGANQLNLKALLTWPSGLHFRILQSFLQDFLPDQNFSLTQKQYAQISQTLASLPAQASFHLGQGLLLHIKGYLGQVTLVKK
ncbi:MAG: tRNA lysidine(34) synthetase TilS [Eubacteriales bacterium]|nr:tRNA lysidine(34) synthetase TilS [Eubacteriales bacterium]